MTLETAAETVNSSQDSENRVWEDNRIQFPRLISEIMATQDLDLECLAESMDLTIDEVNELFDRASEEWESIKAKKRN